MAKCPLCSQRKAQRSCPALGQSICSVCCATKRQKEIQCPATCQYLAGAQYQVARGINLNREVSETFRSEADDVFHDPALVLNFAEPLERAFYHRLVDDPRADDQSIRRAVEKLYLFLTDRAEALAPENRVERKVLEAFEQVDAQKPDVSREEKALVLLRILRTLQKVQVGKSGSRNYLGLVAGMPVRGV